MTNYLRARVTGGTYFFTVNLADRASTALTDHIGHLRAAYAATCKDHPFHTDAIVILPDHLHAVWTLPQGDADFSTRWRLINPHILQPVFLHHLLHHADRPRGHQP